MRKPDKKINTRILELTNAIEIKIDKARFSFPSLFERNHNSIIQKMAIAIGRPRSNWAGDAVFARNAIINIAADMLPVIFRIKMLTDKEIANIVTKLQ
jgi:hypothetical protein